MGSPRRRTAAELAYEAAVRAQAAHQEAVKAFRTSIGVIITAGLAALTFLAEAGVTALSQSSHQGIAWRAISAGVMSLLVMVGGGAVIRLRAGLVLGETTASIAAASLTDPAQLRFEVAEAIEKSVADGQKSLACAQKEAGYFIASLAATASAWIFAIAQYR